MVPTGALQLFKTHWPLEHVPSFALAVGVLLHAAVPQHETAVHTPPVSQHRSLALTGQAAPFTALPQAASLTHAPVLILQIVSGLMQSPSPAQPTHWLFVQDFPLPQSVPVRHSALMHAPSMHRLPSPYAATQAGSPGQAAHA